MGTGQMKREGQVDAYSVSNKKDFGALWENTRGANILLRAMANENRLMILCLLAEGEQSVGEIETMTGARQPTVSQQLARLRADGLVESRRDGKTIYYSLISERTRRVLALLDDFCLEQADEPVAGAGQESMRRG